MFSCQGVCQSRLVNEQEAPMRLNYARRIGSIFFTLSVICLTIRSAGAAKGDPLEANFKNPPSSARPRLWWHWMNGNISEEGIKADLDWMSHIGVGGVQNIQLGLNGPLIVPKRYAYMAPEWKKAFQLATSLADHHGFELAIESTPGWSHTGGPWVKPADGMKKYVWSETEVPGGRPFYGVLPKPPSETGPFEDIRTSEGPSFYADSVVIGYRLPKEEGGSSKLRPKVTTSDPHVNAEALIDGDFSKEVSLPYDSKGHAWVQFEYAHPKTFSALSMVIGVRSLMRMNMLSNGDDFVQEIEASDDGQTFRRIGTTADKNRHSAAQQTVDFPTTTARFFRVLFSPPCHPIAVDIPTGVPSPDPSRKHQTSAQIAEITFRSGAWVQQFEAKAGFGVLEDYYASPTPAVAPAEAISESDVVDLTSRMSPEGRLIWTPPPGNWIVIRFGYSLTGKTNGPAPPEATGLEVDKLNKEAVRRYLDEYLGQYADASGGMMGRRGVQAVLFDSWEAGVENWTPTILADFARLRGYDPKPWLPVLTGRVVASADASDKFLWDFRRTIEDLTVENHYRQAATMLQQRGLIVYVEGITAGRATIGDSTGFERYADIPTGTMWHVPEGAPYRRDLIADIKNAASVANIYGQNIVAVESFTSAGTPFGFAPSALKRTADLIMASGGNRFLIHTSVHQPSDKGPGLSLGPIGQYFTRLETWAEMAGPWISYLSRSCYLLQQGHAVSDVAYFYGQEAPVAVLFRNSAVAPQVPAGWSYDFVSSDVVLNQLAVKNGRLVTKTGASYRLLVLGGSSREMTLPVLRRLRDLVRGGAIVAGREPIKSPSLADNTREFRRIADELWGHAATQQTGEHVLGNGRVFWGRPVGEVLEANGTPADFSYDKSKGADLVAAHRRSPCADIYFVANRHGSPQSLDASFRVSGKEAEFWWPDTGRIQPASYKIAGSQTIVPLQLDPYGSVFVVFRHTAQSKVRTVKSPQIAPLTFLEGAWDVRFQPGRGAPEQATFDKLVSWTDRPESAIRYFSGSATYTKTLNVVPSWITNDKKLWLDLGDVDNVAEASVNGKTVGTAWKRPFRLELTGFLHAGANTLTVKVANLWVNRLIGDQQPGARKYAFTPSNTYKPDSALLPSGLLGPVRIEMEDTH
jgi:hypothetical protein